MCVLSDCAVRIETGLWVIRLHYVVWKPTSEMLLTIWLLWTTRPQCMGVACRGHWPLGTSSAQFTVYRLRHSLTNHELSNCQDGCQTNSRRYNDLLSTGIHDVNKIEDFLDNFISVVVLRTFSIELCLVSFTTGAVRSAIPSIQLGFLSRYLHLNITRSWPWLFWVTWRHRSRDHLIPRMPFLIGAPL